MMKCLHYLFSMRCETYALAERAAASQDATQSKQEYQNAGNTLLSWDYSRTRVAVYGLPNSIRYFFKKKELFDCLYFPLPIVSSKYTFACGPMETSSKMLCGMRWVPTSIIIAFSSNPKSAFLKNKH